jgi:hypothetical protein
MKKTAADLLLSLVVAAALRNGRLFVQSLQAAIFAASNIVRSNSLG